jgi:hypothetical protein
VGIAMTETKPKHRWFRFSLRTIFVLVTVSTGSFWTYQTAGSQPKEGDHGLFLQSIKQLKAGLTQDQASKLIAGTEKAAVFKTEVCATEDSDAAYHPTQTVSYVWDDVIYCVYYVCERGHERDSTGPCVQIQVFRLAEGPYSWEDEKGPSRDEVISSVPSPIKSDDFANHVYTQEFAKFLSSNRKHNNGFKYELIYSDPPTK